MDLQSVLPCSVLKASAIYYKTKLTVHNFTVLNFTEHKWMTILHEKLKKFPHTKNLSNFVDAFHPTKLASSGR
jgi:hypothetical protein